MVLFLCVKGEVKRAIGFVYMIIEKIAIFNQMDEEV
jgi:hypothetical protein